MRPEDIEIEEVDFEALLEESFKKSESKSDLIEGTIVKIDEKDGIVIVDIGGGRDAAMSIDEIKNDDGSLKYRVDDKINVLSLGRGRVSHQAAAVKEALKQFIDEYDESQEYIVEGMITKKNKGGYIVDVDGLEFFLPRTLSYLSSKTDPIGKEIKALIVKVDKARGSVVVSRKELIERERKEKEELINKLLEDKTKVTGTIKKITSYGMFVDVGGVDGLVHYSEISHKGPVNPAKFFNEGDEVEVVAKNYDPKKRHLSLSIKDANPDPWENIDEVLGIGDTVTVTVSNIEPYGAFVDLGQDLEAFLHVSEISWDKNVGHPKEYLNRGDEINVEVIEIDKEKKRLRVSLKSLLPKPMDQFASQYKVGDVVKGEVTSLTDFGAFVKVGSVEGLLHNQEASWDKSTSAKDLFKVGDEVEVKIIRIDKENEKISLSKKALEDSPVQQFAKEHKAGDIVEGTVKDKRDFGVFVNLQEGVDALIRTEDLYPLKIEEIEPGTLLKGVVVHLDPENDRVRMSVKRLKRMEDKETLEEVNKNSDDKITFADVLADKLKNNP